MTGDRYPWLVWQETKPGHWEREIDEAELFYTCLAKAYEGCGRMFFTMTGFVSISIEVAAPSSGKIGQQIREALRIAWLRLRYDHPTIASSVDYDMEQGKWLKSYLSSNHQYAEYQMEEWLRLTFITIDSEISGLDWCNSDPPAPKLPTLFVITPPSTKEDQEGIVRHDIVIRSPHDIIDGFGTLQLLNDLLEYTAQAFEHPNAWVPPPSGSETKNLSPPFRVAAAIPPIPTLDQQAQLQSLIDGNAVLRKNVEILTMPFKNGELLPGKHQRCALQLSVSDTTRVIEASQEVEATITHVYHAAIAITMRDLQESGPEERSARYISYALINERPNCKGDYATSKHAASVYHSVSGENLALDLTIPSGESIAGRNEHTRGREDRKEFYLLVDTVKIYYHTIRNSPHRIALAPAFWSMATPNIFSPTTTGPVPAPNVKPSVGLSSIGVIDRIIAPQHDRFSVHNPWVTGDELGTGLGVFLGTWQGKLELSAAYNDAWHDKEEVEAFLEHCHGVVWKGLGLDNEMDIG